MRIAIASFAGMPPDFRDDERLAGLLRERGAEAAIVAWDDADAGWDGFDLVVVRSTWDYALRRDEFVAWAERIGERLLNPPALIRWNSDKRYLEDLDAAGIAVVETAYLDPGTAAPAIEREVVVKPTVSAGGRDTGRFSPGRAEAARALIAGLHADGRTAMVQPYLGSVDAAGETAIVFIDGEPSHALRKRAVLGPDEVAPVRDDGLGAAEAMYDPELVLADRATEAELAVARDLVTRLGERFGGPPLYARVDMLATDAGPVVLELEAVEPNLYLAQAPGAGERLADAILARAAARR